MSDITPRPYSKDYEITDAMFGAFRAPGGSRFFWTLMGWTTALFTLVYVLFLPPIIRAYVSMFGALMQIDETNPDPEQSLEAVSNMLGIIPWFFLLMIGSLAVISVVRAAFYRNYFFGEDGGRFPFRFGGDELRQFLAMLGYYGLFMLGYFGIMFILGIFIGVLGATSNGANLGIAMALMGLLYIGLLVFLVWYGIKFAPAAALTGLRRKTHVLAARHISKHRFWALFGSIIVAGIIGYVVSYAAMIIGAMLGLSGLFSLETLNALSGNDAEGALQGIFAQSQTMGFKIGAFFAIAMASAGYAFYAVLLMGPSAFFVKQWSDSDPSKAFE